MLDWLKKIGGSKPWQNKAGLDEKSVELLAEDFGALEKLDPNLPIAVVRYLLDGEGEEVLGNLANLQGAGETLALIGPFVAGKAIPIARTRFFESARNAPPDFFVRLGKVYDAARSAPSSNPVLRSFRNSGAPAQASLGDAGLNWLHMLLVTATQLTVNTWPRSCRISPALNADLIEAMLESVGFPGSVLARAAFLPTLQRFGGAPLEVVFVGLKGMADCGVRHKEILFEALAHPDFKQRVYALQLMQKCNVPIEPFLPKLVDLVIGSSKQVREQTQILLIPSKGMVIPLLKEKIISGENDERIAAARLMWHWDEASAREYLEQRLTEEKSKKVVQAIQDLLAVPGEKSAPAIGDPLQLPELPPIPSHNPLGAETKQAWEKCLDLVNHEITKIQTTNSQHYHAKSLKPLSVKTIERAFDELQGGECGKPLEPLATGLVFGPIANLLKTFWQRPELQQIHLVRFLIQAGGLKPDSSADDRYALFGHWFELVVVAYHRAHPEAGLREFGAAFTAAGLDSARLGKALLRRFSVSSSHYGISDKQAWPYWTEHLDLLEKAFAPPPADFMQRFYLRGARERAFDALKCFPQPPPRLLPLLWNLALGSKSERPPAQECLTGVPDKFERLVAALSGGSAETRFAAAEWLGRLNEKKAIDPILAALKREKNEAAKGMMLATLEQLGAPVEQFLDRAGLLKEAEKGLAKGVPADLNWFPFDQLPAVHWEDTGKQVDPGIARWWLVQAFKLKSPQPGALLRRYCKGLKTSEREALGQFILDAWLAEDLSPIPPAEAEKLAKSHAQSMAHFAQYTYQQAQKNPQGQTPVPPPLTADQYYAQALPRFLKQPKGSAVASKGILAVAGACVGAAAPPVVNRYLKEWYGQRAAQCRAMLQMLAWVEHRTATQLLLAVGSRFRTKSIQEEANDQAQALAERKGWTVAELADRTIPSAGMDENGVLLIDFGPRKFTARLDEDMEFALTDADGKPLKALPEPRKDDDEAMAVEAKKNFSAAKKELKSVLTMQRDRFYEAMCTQRTWPHEDWNLYLNRHPIVRNHCHRLVWAVVRDDKVVQLFRPLPDGSLTNVTDDPVALDGGDLVRVAHECQVTPEESQAWRQHLKDYDIEMLFEQFGRQNFTLSEENRSETDVKDFEGHILEAFKLRGRASKLGYTRGQAQDGGWFLDYHKRFPTLGIEAVIEFTGNSLPEENRTVALTALCFNRVGEGDGDFGEMKMQLSDVPSVLLSECWNDIRAIAAEGPGFDAGWEKKTGL